jgi:hypothetical protein
LVWVEAFNTAGPGCIYVPDGFLAEIKRTSGVWQYARSGGQALLAEYRLTDGRITFERRWK